MPQDLRAEVFTTAGAYHAAIARYCRALRTRQDIETPVQELLGHSIFYRSALEKLLATGDRATGERRLRCLRILLAGASRQYTALKRGKLIAD